MLFTYVLIACFIWIVYMVKMFCGLQISKANSKDVVLYKTIAITIVSLLWGIVVLGGILSFSVSGLFKLFNHFQKE